VPTAITHERHTGTTGDALTIGFSGGQSVLGWTLLVAWLAGWLIVLASIGSQVLQRGIAASPLALVAGALVFAGGVLVLIPLVWVALGRPETVVVAGGVLWLHRHGVITISRTFPPFTIRSVRLAPEPRAWWLAVVAVRRFWVGGIGRIEVDAGGEVHACGTRLADDEAERLVGELKALTLLGQPGTSSSAAGVARALRTWSARVATFVLFLPMVLLPFRALVTDRTSCFGASPGEPQFPTDVRGLAPAGRVLLVPLDDFPAAQAQSMASWFRQRFGTRIDVAVPLVMPASVFDAERGQVDGVALVRLLERRYPVPADRQVTVALTARDMYIPHRPWRYAFSYRGGERFAVVSSMRMNHGCLGIVAAHEDVRTARLRKMVAKNVGVLHYGLPLSRDERSLMYADIGGPQELDVMSESY
jgi:hypothetical protein